MSYRKSGSDDPWVTLIGSSIVLIILACFLCRGCVLGTGGWGPENDLTVQVQRLYVDAGEASSYMVGTDKGVFEVDNGWMLGVWNADEIYSRLEVGRRYEITTKGNRVVAWYSQSYPYIVRVRALQVEQ